MRSYQWDCKGSWLSALDPCRQDRLKIRRLLLAGHDTDFGIAEPDFLEHGVEFNTGEAEPDVGVEFLGLFVGVDGEVEDQDATARFEDPEGALHSPLRSGRMMKRLAEENHID